MTNTQANKLRIKYVTDAQKASILIYNYDVTKSIIFATCIGLILLFTSLFNETFFVYFLIIEFIAILYISMSCRRTEIAFLHSSSQITITVMGISKKITTLSLNSVLPNILLSVEVGEHKHSKGKNMGVFLNILLNSQQKAVNLVDFSKFLSNYECQSLASEANVFIQTQILNLSSNINSD